MTHGYKLHEIMEVAEPAIACTVSNGLAQARLTVKQGLHGAVLGKDAVPGSAVPVDLSVKIVAIQLLCSRFDIIESVARPAIRSWNQCENLCGDGVNRRKHVASVLSTPSATSNASCGRKNHSRACLLRLVIGISHKNRGLGEACACCRI